MDDGECGLLGERSGEYLHHFLVLVFVVVVDYNARLALILVSLVLSHWLLN